MSALAGPAPAGSLGFNVNSFLNLAGQVVSQEALLEADLEGLLSSAISDYATRQLVRGDVF